MKFTTILTITLAILLIIITGCSTTKNSPEPTINTTNTVQEVQDLLFSEQDIQQLGLTSGGDAQDLETLELMNIDHCRTEEYNTSEYSPLEQYSICSYSVDGLNYTSIIIELKKFANLNELNGSYQYESGHLRSIDGLLSQNDYGDQSKFYINSVNDYGGEFTNKSISYYALYITKGTYMIYISSKGSIDAKDYVAKIGRQILSKFE